MTLFISTVYIAGLLSFFAPCTYAMMPVYIGLLTDYSKNKMATLIKTLLFVLGLGVTFVTLGFGAGFVGKLLQFDSFYWIAGGLIVLMGLHQMELIRIHPLEKTKTSRVKFFKSSYLTAFSVGLTFSFAWTPCVGPVLASILIVAAESSQSLYGAGLMLVYTLGLATPFVIIALLSGVLLNRMNNLEKHLLKIKRIGGVLIVIMGVLLATRQLNTFTVWIENLF